MELVIIWTNLHTSQIQDQIQYNMPPTQIIDPTADDVVLAGKFNSKATY